MTEAIYITTAIPYVNGAPHLGHATEFVLTDALARYYRQRGDTVRFLTGTDENSLKNARAAVVEGIPVEQLVARNAELFAALREPLALSNDDFIRTSADPRHERGALKLWEACRAAGDIYKKPYRGLYCVGCEQFFAPEELIEGVCPEHGTEPEEVEEENYFFRLSRYGEKVARLIETGRLIIEPVAHRNALLRFIEKGLEDISISRSRSRARGWGIQVPNDPEQVIYVWFDALSNYINGLDYAESSTLFRQFWSGADARVHVIGKGVTRFHGIYWPAILLSANLEVPSHILVHSYVTVNGQKIAKSLGNTVDPRQLAAAYGTDVLRYFLLRHVRTTSDSDFSEARLREALNSELADQLGNLVSRTVSLVQKFSAGEVPGAVPSPLERIPEILAQKIDAAIERFRPHEALEAIFEQIAALNRYVSAEQPWVLAKDPSHKGKLDQVLFGLAESLRIIGLCLEPFLPSTSRDILDQLGYPSGEATWGTAPSNAKVTSNVLFPRV